MPPVTGLKTVLSKIHGYGVVTTRKYLAGEILLYGDGVLWQESDDFDDTYALALPSYETAVNGVEGPNVYWDLTCQGRWINHSCNPNTEVDCHWEPNSKNPIAWWFAKRDIAAGEELTYDYAFSAALAEPCFCSEQNCRGVIADDEELHLVPEKYKHLIKESFRFRRQ